VVDTPETLEQALAARPYDVVIAYAVDLPAINTGLARAASEPSLIPVFQRDSDTMRKQYPLALNEGADLNQFLKTIEETMKSRGT